MTVASTKAQQFAEENERWDRRVKASIEAARAAIKRPISAAPKAWVWLEWQSNGYWTGIIVVGAERVESWSFHDYGEAMDWARQILDSLGVPER